MIYLVFLGILFAFAYAWRVHYLIKHACPPAGVGQEIIDLGLIDERPNCVSTHANDAAREVAPITFDCPPDHAMARLVDALQNEPRTKIVYQSANRVDVVFLTALLGVPHDMNVRLNRIGERFELRSRSRVGYLDLGVNRRRVERLRRVLAKSHER